MTKKLTLSEKYTKAEDEIPDIPILKLGVNNCYKEDHYLKEAFIIDTGADITLINFGIFDLLDLKIVSDGEVEIEGLEKDKNGLTNTVFLDLVISELAIKERIEAAINPYNETNILGRDFLNRVSIHFDGPERQFTIYG